MANKKGSEILSNKISELMQNIATLKQEVADLKKVQEFNLEETVKLKAKQEAFLEICDAFKLIDLDLIDVRSANIEQEILLEIKEGISVEEDCSDSMFDSVFDPEYCGEWESGRLPLSTI